TDPDTLTTYKPSLSSVVTVITAWNFKDTSSCPNGHCHIAGRLIPHVGRHKIVVEVRHGSWKPYRTVRTSARGTYRVPVSGSWHGTKYRMTITGTRNLAAIIKKYRVIKVAARGASTRAGITLR